jgi:nicotinate-nucleotide pyrophosphorylase (carboxylating)
VTETFSRSDWRRIDGLIDLALAEDLGAKGDVTTAATVGRGAMGEAQFIAKKSGVAAGLPIAQRVMKKADPALKCRFSIPEGGRLETGSAFGDVKGPIRGILSVERTVLNFLQRLSGIATLTSEFVQRVRGTGTSILDTRKTTPGMRILEKYAVRIGGGVNHRFGLYDMVLIKNNHVDAAGGIGPAVKRCMAFVKRKNPDLKIEVETRTLKEVREALEHPVHRIMLDNMDVPSIRQAVRMAGGRVELEASGNVNLENVRSIAETGVQFISIGALTHSPPALDMSLHVTAGPHGYEEKT